jgi:uncharacterized membrane protein SirB2
VGAVKLIHIITATLSISGFVLRGIWKLTDSPLLRQRWVRIVPHVNDTLLLGLGLWLAFSIRQYPFVHAWLTAKIVAILAYIGLGMVALRFGKTRAVRVTAFAAALAVFAYIVAVALTRSATLSIRGN